MDLKLTLSTAAVVSTLTSLLACTVYQSDGREAIEKNSANLVTATATGHGGNKAFYYECYRSPAPPSEWQRAPEQIENPLSHVGLYSHRLRTNFNDKNTVRLLATLVPTQTFQAASDYNFCYLDLEENPQSVLVQESLQWIGDLLFTLSRNSLD